ncbi:3-oxo-tetronate kinase [Pseudomonas putida]|uniref:3-oxo-tetronate kinase n=1 Tax=Pseudomonas putida TaxID=303 RepID=UPI0024E09B93|nr:3-oxo-tetronate kinase [Pseudomonas putida]HDS0966559.1 four-carbon acid sugar kinase family protein [Pseudomonas putida]HDS0967540.1 four-carbon acid sugar kinase family protein [Pseudomonas putida]HDS0990304.1 four-carbon acid sugar kinase family protein [Pseudomonas putida]HDS0993969.1 four-carbon acid sugar kinase family protein [Pseudomonas putida]
MALEDWALSQVLLGCIADDFTGATDLASMLVRSGLRTVLVIGVPQTPLDANVDAVVIALKTRTMPPDEAVDESLAALAWLRKLGCRQYFYKYCSTFDSTSQGNIGPIADALIDALGLSFALVCPAFPENHRTLYNGHLFVGETLLSESSMRDHPLTPMTDSNVVRVLQQQTARKVGLINHSVIQQGAEAVRQAFANAQEDGFTYAVVDAISNHDLQVIGEAASDHVLVTGGSGVAMGLPGNFQRRGLLADTCAASLTSHVDGYAAVLSGSCSKATLDQVEHWKCTGRPYLALDPLLLAKNHDKINEALAWAKPLLVGGPVLIYASALPAEVKDIQTCLGAMAAGEIVEHALSQIAVGLRDAGVNAFVVAGGETSGAVVRALGITALRIGDPIDPGVPWTTGTGDYPIALALKSGNFGSRDFFSKALELAP